MKGAAHHRLAGRAEVELAELAGEAISVVTRELSSGTYDLIEEACLSSGFVPRLVSAAILPPSVTARSQTFWFNDVVLLRAPTREDPTLLVPDAVRIPLHEQILVGLYMLSMRSRYRPDLDQIRASIRSFTADRRGW